MTDFGIGQQNNYGSSRDGSVLRGTCGSLAEACRRFAVRDGQGSSVGSVFMARPARGRGRGSATFVVAPSVSLVLARA